MSFYKCLNGGIPQEKIRDANHSVKIRGVYSSIIPPPPTWWEGGKNQRILGPGKKIKEE